MNSYQFRIAQLITLFIDDRISEEELRELELLLTSHPELNDWIKQKGVKHEEVRGRIDELSKLDLNDEWRIVLEKLNKKLKIKRLTIIGAAASLFLITFSALFFSKTDRTKDLIAEVNSSTSIVPGQGKAILTLSSGEDIVLDSFSNSAIVDGNTTIDVVNNGLDYSGSKTEGNVLHRLKIPFGGTYHLQLEDGTKVWLNADSELEFPTSFEHAENRVVMVKGEAYFEIAKDKKRPFIVKVNGIEIEALGTAFNINTHIEENTIKTILTEGRIRVTNKGLKKEINAGYEINSKKDELFVQKADLNEAVSWKEGYFYFDSKSVKTILEEISRWYNVDLEIRTTMNTETYKGSMKRTESIMDVCGILTDLTNYKVSFDNNKVVVQKKTL